MAANSNAWAEATGLPSSWRPYHHPILCYPRIQSCSLCSANSIEIRVTPDLKGTSVHKKTASDHAGLTPTRIRELPGGGVKFSGDSFGHHRFSCSHQLEPLGWYETIGPIRPAHKEQKRIETQLIFRGRGRLRQIFDGGPRDSDSAI
jgi:hypothetical protein